MWARSATTDTVARETWRRSAASDRRRPSMTRSRPIVIWRLVKSPSISASTGASRSRSASVAGSPLDMSRLSRRAPASARRSRARRNAGPVRWVAGPVPGSTSPATITQRIGLRSGLKDARSTASSGSAPGASSPWSSSPWVNSNGARSDPGSEVASSSAVRVRNQVVEPLASRLERMTSPKTTIAFMGRG